MDSENGIFRYTRLTSNRRDKERGGEAGVFARVEFYLSEYFIRNMILFRKKNKNSFKRVIQKSQKKYKFNILKGIDIDINKMRMPSTEMHSKTHFTRHYLMMKLLLRE